ncbi:UNVERIFIED_CONTAM: hypothetical protein Slati_3186500 [Sesamum latifolium]|uniref:Uncharacterized protein n=1 Tax=Sesamum latifolium TaxID=2727402 RepID=A0AAW2UZR4_9LAMI
MALEQLSLGPRPVDGGPDGRQVSGDGGAGGMRGARRLGYRVGLDRKSLCLFRERGWRRLGLGGGGRPGLLSGRVKSSRSGRRFRRTVRGTG